MTSLTDNYFINQILLLQKIVRNYQDHLISFQSLITSIEELLDLWENYNEEWKENLKSLWFELEIKYSIVLSEDRLDFTDEENQQVNKTIEKIYSLVEKQVNNIPEDYWYQKTQI